MERKIKAVYVGTPNGIKPLTRVIVNGETHEVKIVDGKIMVGDVIWNVKVI